MYNLKKMECINYKLSSPKKKWDITSPNPPSVTKVIANKKLFGSTNKDESAKSKSTFKREKEIDSDNILLKSPNNKAMVKQEKEMHPVAPSNQKRERVPRLLR